jgi:hypothetical protein
MSEQTNRPATAREVFTALPHLLTAPYIPEVHGDLDDEPEPLSPERRAEIAARAEAATPGPWCTDSSEIYQGTEYTSWAVWVGETCDPDDRRKSRADAEFIAAARTDVPALLAEVEQLREAAAENFPGELAMLRGLLGVIRVTAKYGDMDEVRRLLGEYDTDESAARAESGKVIAPGSHTADEQGDES